MQPIIVFDLRNHHVVAGIIDSLHGKLRWKPEMIQVLQREGGSPDPVLEADLCFFRPPREKRWIPIFSEGLDQLSDDFEKISDLFGQTDIEQIQAAIRTGLLPLLRPLLSDRKELEILFLVDSFQIADYLSELSQKLNRPNRVVVASNDADSLAGYALLDMDQTLQSQEGKIMTCAVGKKLHNYQWTPSGFEMVPVMKPNPESKWDEIGDLERVGLVAFEMVWSVAFVQPFRIRLEELTRENGMLSILLEKMDEICVELRGLSARRPVPSA